MQAPDDSAQAVVGDYRGPAESVGDLFGQPTIVPARRRGVAERIRHLLDEAVGVVAEGGHATVAIGGGEPVAAGCVGVVDRHRARPAGRVGHLDALGQHVADVIVGEGRGVSVAVRPGRQQVAAKRRLVRRHVGLGHRVLVLGVIEVGDPDRFGQRIAEFVISEVGDHTVVVDPPGNHQIVGIPRHRRGVVQRILDLERPTIAVEAVDALFAARIGHPLDRRLAAGEGSVPREAGRSAFWRQLLQHLEGADRFVGDGGNIRHLVDVPRARAALAVDRVL